MSEKRKGHRYQIFLRVYFPESDLWGHTSNISLDGCYVVVDSSMAVGFITELLVELPVIGAISLKGYVQHKKSNLEPGVGLQFVQVRFEPKESAFYDYYSQFLRHMPQLEQIRKTYMESVQHGQMKLCILPKDSEIKSLTEKID